MEGGKGIMDVAACLGNYSTFTWAGRLNMKRTYLPIHSITW